MSEPRGNFWKSASSVSVWTSLDLEDFRDDILRLSGHLPGSIVRMCELAADSRYHYGDRIKIKLVHVDYLMQSNPSAINRAPAFLQ